jgi:arsenite methyltransferase
MTSAMTFDDKAAQRVEAIYTTLDVSATRVAVFRALEPRSGERIADLGCGPGFMTQELARAVGPHGHVHALDLSEPMLTLARRRCADLPSVETAIGDMTSLNLPDGSLDAVVAMQSLAYVPEVARALVEIARSCALAGEP